MRQILLNAEGALIARLPRPAPRPGSVLVRTAYSLVSSGTEIAPLLAAEDDGSATEAPAARAASMASLSLRYLGKAVRNPRKAVMRVGAIAGTLARDVLPRRTEEPVYESVETIGWQPAGARALSVDQGRLAMTADDSRFGYQCVSTTFRVEAGQAISVALSGALSGAPLTLGVVAGGDGPWIGTTPLAPGRLDEAHLFVPEASGPAAVVFANADGEEPARLDAEVRVSLTTGGEGAAPDGELGQQGWAVGYSLAGEVIAVGDGVADLRPGDLVACAGAGQANHADYVSVRRNLVCRVPAGCDLSAAATATVGAIALQGVRRADVQLGDRICVLGLGLLGQLTVQLLKAAGADVVGFDPEPSRLARARSCGLDAGAHEEDALRRMVRDLTAGHGADVVIVAAATKSSSPANLAFDLVRRRGRVVLVGDVGLHLERPLFYKKEVDVLMSTSYGPGRYDRLYEEEGRDYPLAYVRWTLNRNLESYMKLVAAGRVDPSAVVDRVVPLEEATKVYRQLAQEAPRPLGVLFSYARGADAPADDQTILLRGAKPPPREGPARALLVGAGAFATAMLVPQMERLPERFRVVGVASADPVRGGNYAKAKGIALLASDLDAALAATDIDVAVIATRHVHHAPQVVQALLAGCDVFVEKPLALSWQQLDSVVQAYRSRSPLPVLMVGFNRRFSPAIRTLASELQGRRGPLMMVYRVNGGYIPADHWLQGPDGGGRNLGEACHMYDVLRMLAGSPVSEIEAAPIGSGDAPHRPTDNFSATLRYGDGSVGTLIYTALGPAKGLGKERIEIFCDGDAWVIDDFRSLYRASDQTWSWRAEEPDKGHWEEIRRFGEALSGRDDAPIPFDEIIEVTATSLAVQEALTGSG